MNKTFDIKVVDEQDMYSYEVYYKPSWWPFYSSFSITRHSQEKELLKHITDRLTKLYKREVVLKTQVTI